MKPSGKKNKRARKGSQNATVGLPHANIPSEVRTRMRLGIYLSQGVQANTPNVTRLNDPLQVCPFWAVRSEPFEQYRIVGLRMHITPSVLASGSVSATDTRTYISALLESTGAPPTPSVFSSVLELPQAQIRPMNTANPRSMRTVSWRCRDLNALIFVNVTSAPAANQVNVFLASNGSSPVTGWQFNITGYIDVEFKGLAILS